MTSASTKERALRGHVIEREAELVWRMGGCRKDLLEEISGLNSG